MAAAQSRRVAEASEQLAIAREHVNDARGRLLPTTTGSGRYTWYSDAQHVLPNFRGVPPGTTITLREKELGVLNGTATMPIDLSGELRHALAASQAAYRGERARLWATTLEQERAAIDAYFALLAAERLREVTDQRITLQRDQLDHARSRFDAGRLTKNEMLVVAVALETTEADRVQRGLDIDHARWLLNETIGLAVDAPTEVADIAVRPVTPSAPEALRLAYAANPMLIGLLEEQQRLDETTRSLARSRLPRFNGGGAIDYSTSSVIQPQDIASGFVGFTLDLGTDGRREADIAAARHGAEQNRIAIEAALRALESAIRTAQRAVEARLAALDAAATAVGQAEENLRIRRQQFDAGRATSDDVLDAEALLSVQRATLATARYEAHTRRAELQQLMGLPLDDVAAPR
jgi:outer membrane protein TolC